MLDKEIFDMISVLFGAISDGRGVEQLSKPRSESHVACHSGGVQGVDYIGYCFGVGDP